MDVYCPIHASQPLRELYGRCRTNWACNSRVSARSTDNRGHPRHAAQDGRERRILRVRARNKRLDKIYEASATVLGNALPAASNCGSTMKRLFCFLFLAGSVFGQAPRPPVDRLSQLRDVLLTSPTNNQALIYDSGLAKWKNGAGGGGTGEQTPYINVL